VTRTIGVTQRADWRPTRAQAACLEILHASSATLYT
jgi:hypothetical protein